jgi:protein-tyrosine phosphatase
MPYWLNLPTPAKLAIVPRPRGGDWLDDEIRNLRRDGIEILVSLLTPPEDEELNLDNEAAACESEGIEFYKFPIPDRQCPPVTQTFRTFIDELRAQRAQGKNIGVHCRAGIGRSSLTLASILSTEGYTPDDAFDLISEARQFRVPDTKEQIEWVRNFSQL